MSNSLNLTTISNESHDVALGERIKMYENTPLPTTGKIKPEDNFIIRLDGRSFSAFTGSFVKPFDPIFIKAMCYTAQDLLEKFNCQTAYTHSDEITLIFSRQYPDKSGTYVSVHLFDGRVQKIISLTASYCSVRFNWHLSKLFEQNAMGTNPVVYPENLIKKVFNCEQMFDARCICFPDELAHEIVNHQIWRSVYDSHRNAVQAYAHVYIGKKNCMGKNSAQLINMLDETGISWSDVPRWIKYGFYCKKDLYEKEVDGQIISRAKCTFKSFRIEFSKQIQTILLAKYWDNTDCIKENANVDISLI